MAITLTVGLSRKVGQPGYGSISATCNVTFEADNGLLENGSFHARVAEIFSLCSSAVEDELAQQDRGAGSGYVPPAVEGRAAELPQTRSEVNRTFRKEEPAPAPPPSGQPDVWGGSPPRSGKALYACLKKQQEAGADGLLNYVNDWAKRGNHASRMVDWEPGVVAEAVNEAEDFILNVLPNRSGKANRGTWGGSTGDGEPGTERRSGRRAF